MSKIDMQSCQLNNKIQSSKNVEEGILIALEDGKYDECELQSLLEKFIEEKNQIIQNFLDNGGNINKINEIDLKNFLLNCDLGYIVSNTVTLKNELLVVDVLKKLTEKEPYKVYKYIINHNNVPGIFEILKILANNNQNLAFDYIKKYKNIPGALEILEIVAKKFPDLIFQGNIFLYDHINGYIEIMKIALMEKPYLASQYVNDYINKPFALDLLKVIVEIKPKIIFEIIKYLDKNPDLETEVLKLIAEKSSKLFFDNIFLFYDNGLPRFSEILEIAVNENPFQSFRLSKIFFQYPELFTNIRNMDLLELKAKKYPFDVFMAEKYLQDIEGYKKILDIAININYLKIAAKENSSSAFIFFDKYKEIPGALEVLKIAAEKDPYLAFEFFDKYKEIPGALEVLKVTAEKDPYLAFKFFDKYKEIPGALEVLKIASEKNPRLAFEFFDKYKDIQGALEVLKIAAQEDARSAFEYFDKYKDMQGSLEVLKIAVNKKPFLVFEFFEKYKEISGFEEITKSVRNIDNLKIAAQEDARSAFEYFKKYKDIPGSIEILKIAAKKDSYGAFNHFNEYKDIPGIIEVLKIAAKYPNDNLSINYIYGFISDNKNISGVIELLKIAVDNTPELLFMNIEKYKDIPGIIEILKVAAEKDSTLVFRTIKDYKNIPGAIEVLKIGARKDPYSAFKYYRKYSDMSSSIEILKIAKELISKKPKYLEVGEIINYLHEENENLRFMIIEDFNENQLYNLIINGREEIFTSSYNGIINRLLSKLSLSGKNIYSLIQNNNFKGIHIFLEAAASYNRINDLFSKLTIEEKNIIIDKLLDEDKINGNVNIYISIIEIILTSGINTELLDKIKTKVLENYEKGKNKDAWGIIAKKLKISDIPDKYSLKDLKGIENKTLFDDKGRNIQRYYFYNDDDGKSSFNNFISTYKNDGWNIENKSDFVIVSKKVNQRQIIIVANKPEKEDENSVSNYMNENNLSSQIIVHRGHSYHALKTINEITNSAHMVFLGSCGGYQNIGKVLEKSNNAQIISTKGTGTMTVNDPLFKSINETLLRGNNIDWSKIWDTITPQLKYNELFGDYIRPDKNTGVMFYNKLISLQN